MVREAIANEAQVSLFYVLLDGIERLLFGDFHLRVGEARNFDNHVEDALVAVYEEGDVMEGRDNGAVLFDVDAVVCHAVVRTEENEWKDETNRGCWEPR